ncbi:uncharacterized protein LOC133458672 isoform X2 [Cololabis saira]|uniref:uncharacterized protein LOC133458672 isoform X2 n=1 Tax=Cololabis saira TaxID=129043 RepID=UPI002AD3283D|nr:uncharacterized protein LOC133458672 isoform X2 [Cololabis saira]
MHVCHKKEEKIHDFTLKRWNTFKGAQSRWLELSGEYRDVAESYRHCQHLQFEDVPEDAGWHRYCYVWFTNKTIMHKLERRMARESELLIQTEVIPVPCSSNSPTQTQIQTECIPVSCSSNSPTQTEIQTECIPVPCSSNSPTQTEIQTECIPAQNKPQKCYMHVYHKKEEKIHDFTLKRWNTFKVAQSRWLELSGEFRDVAESYRHCQHLQFEDVPEDAGWHPTCYLRFTNKTTMERQARDVLIQTEVIPAPCSSNSPTQTEIQTEAIPVPCSSNNRNYYRKCRTRTQIQTEWIPAQNKPQKCYMHVYHKKEEKIHDFTLKRWNTFKGAQSRWLELSGEYRDVAESYRHCQHLQFEDVPEDAGWHTTCYVSFTNKTTMKALERRMARESELLIQTEVIPAPCSSNSPTQTEIQTECIPVPCSSNNRNYYRKCRTQTQIQTEWIPAQNKPQKCYMHIYHKKEEKIHDFTLKRWNTFKVAQSRWLELSGEYRDVAESYRHCQHLQFEDVPEDAGWHPTCYLRFIDKTMMKALERRMAQDVLIQTEVIPALCSSNSPTQTEIQTECIPVPCSSNKRNYYRKCRTQTQIQTEVIPAQNKPQKCYMHVCHTKEEKIHDFTLKRWNSFKTAQERWLGLSGEYRDVAESYRHCQHLQFEDVPEDAGWHPTCYLRFNNKTMMKALERRMAQDVLIKTEWIPAPCSSRSNSPTQTEIQTEWIPAPCSSNSPTQTQIQTEWIPAQNKPQKCYMHVYHKKEEKIHDFTLKRWNTFKRAQSRWLELSGEFRDVAESYRHCQHLQFEDVPEDAGWHPTCYHRFTNKTMMKASERRMARDVLIRTEWIPALCSSRSNSPTQTEIQTEWIPAPCSSNSPTQTQIQTEWIPAQNKPQKCYMHVYHKKEEKIHDFTLKRWNTFKRAQSRWLELSGEFRDVAESYRHCQHLQFEDVPEDAGWHPTCYARFTNKTMMDALERRMAQDVLIKTEWIPAPCSSNNPTQTQIQTEWIPAPCSSNNRNYYRNSLTQTQIKTEWIPVPCSSNSNSNSPTPTKRLRPESPLPDSGSVLPALCIICKKDYINVPRGGKRVRDCLTPAETVTAGWLQKAAKLKEDHSILMHIKDKDCVAIGVQYHKYCYTLYTQFLRVPPEPDTNQNEPTYDMTYQVFCETVIRQRLLVNQEVLRMTQLRGTFIEMVKSHEGLDASNYRQDRLKRRLRWDFPQLVFHAATNRNVCELVYAETLSTDHIMDTLPFPSCADTTQSKTSELEKPWRTVVWEPEKRAELMESIKSFKPTVSSVSQARVLLIGPVGAGKSSFFNSVNSVFRGHVTNRAISGYSTSSLTTQFRSYSVKAGRGGNPLPVILCDTMGLEESKGAGLHIDDVSNILKGHLPDYYQFNPSDPLHSEVHGYRKSPDHKDKIHCVVYVIDASKISIMTPQLEEKVDAIRKKINLMGIPQLALLSKVDEACPLVKEDLRNIYKSGYIKDLMQEVSTRLGMPMSYVVPVKNYSEELELDMNCDILLLSAITQMLQSVDNYFDEFQE